MSQRKYGVIERGFTDAHLTAWGFWANPPTPNKAFVLEDADGRIVYETPSIEEIHHLAPGLVTFRTHNGSQFDLEELPASEVANDGTAK